MEGEGFTARGVGGLHPGGREVTACRRGFTAGVPAVGGGLPTRNSVTGKMRLKRRWSCKGRWREILHGETANNGSLSRRVGGGLQLQFRKGGFGEWGFISSKTMLFLCQKHQYRFISRTTGSTGPILVQLVRSWFNLFPV